MSFEEKTAELHELSDDDISEVVGGTRTDLYNNIRNMKKEELVQAPFGSMSHEKEENRQRNKKHKMTRIASSRLP